MTPLEATEELRLALLTVPDLRVAVGLGRPLAPPVAVVGPPVLTWDGYCEGGPSSGVWSIYLVTSLTEFAVEQLLRSVPSVVAAIEKETSGTVTTATPGTYPSGQQGDLPAYLIEIDMELSD